MNKSSQKKFPIERKQLDGKKRVKNGFAFSLEGAKKNFELRTINQKFWIN